MLDFDLFCFKTIMKMKDSIILQLQDQDQKKIRQKMQKKFTKKDPLAGKRPSISSSKQRKRITILQPLDILNSVKKSVKQQVEEKKAGLIHD